MSFDEKNFYVDLVFYNRLLKFFILIELKIGIILYWDKNKVIVETTLPEDNTQIFASKYQLITM